MFAIVKLNIKHPLAKPRKIPIEQYFSFPGYGGGLAHGGLVTTPRGYRRVLFWDCEGRLTYPCNGLVFDTREDDTFERIETDG